MYVVNVYYYLYNFRNTLNCATMKTEIPIENGRSLKLRQTGLGAIAPHLQPAPNRSRRMNERMTPGGGGGPKGE